MPVGLADVVARGDLRWKDNGSLRAFQPSGFDTAVLQLSDAAIRRLVPTGILLPVGGLRAAAVLAAAVLVRHVAETGSPTAKVALVSKQLSLRPFYRALHIVDICLSDFYPLEIILQDGRCSRVGQQRPGYGGYGGRLRMSVNIGRLAALRDRHQGIIIEAGTGAPGEVSKLIRARAREIPLIYLTANPFDPVLDELEGSGAVWAWTPEEIGRLAGDEDLGSAICADVEVLRNAATTVFHVIGPDSQDGLDEVLPRLWDDLKELQHHGGSLAPRQLRWGWAVAAGLSQLAVPVHYFDRQARSAWRTATVGDAAERAAAFARNAASEDREFWDVFAEDLRDAVEAARVSVKPKALADWVTERDGAGSGLVVVRNRAAVAAVVDFLDERPGIPLRWRDSIRITTFEDLQRGREPWCPEATLLSGPVPWSRSGLIAMPAARELVTLTHGPWETGRAVRQIAAVARRLGQLAGGGTRDAAVLRLYGESPQDSTPTVEVRPEIVHTSTEAPRTPPAAREPVWNPFDVRIAQNILGEDDIDEPDHSGSEETGRAGSVEALVVTFNDGTGFFDADLRVSRIREGDESEVAVKSLRPGDRVVLVDRGARTDLFHLVTSKLEELPEFIGVVSLVREWQARAARAQEPRGGGSVVEVGSLTLVTVPVRLTYQQILEEMRRLGSSITTPAAISHWVHGRVHGPADPEDIRRLGQVIGDEVLVNRWQAMARALKTMRGHRRRVARMLARALEAASLDDLEGQGYFDRRLGIHLSELAEAVSDHTCVDVSSEKVTVPVHVADVLLEPAEAERILESSREERE